MRPWGRDELGGLPVCWRFSLLASFQAGPSSGFATAVGTLTAGSTPAGNVEMYAPAAGISGSSMTHFSTTLAPPQIMGPYYLEGDLELRVTRAALWDSAGGSLRLANSRR